MTKTETEKKLGKNMMNTRKQPTKQKQKQNITSTDDMKIAKNINHFFIHHSCKQDI